MARTPSHPALAGGAHPFPHEHLLGIAQLKPWEIAFLLDEAEQWVDMNRSRSAKRDERLAGLTGTLLVEALPLIEAAGPGPEAERLQRLGVRVQSEEGMTYARMLTKEDAQIDWSQSALSIHRKVMGLYPGATSSWQGKRLKLLVTEPLVKRLAAELSPEAAELAARWGLAPGEYSAGRTIIQNTV